MPSQAMEYITFDLKAVLVRNSDYLLTTQQAFTFSKSTMETPEDHIKSLQS